MDKKIYCDEEFTRFVSDEALQALADGEGQRVVGSESNGIVVGRVYTPIAVQHRISYFNNDATGMEDSEFNQLSEEERMNRGTKRSWFEFNTDNGALSFTAVLGFENFNTREWWDNHSAELTDVVWAEGYEPEDLWVPTARTPAAFIKGRCEGVISKKLKCVVTAVRHVRENFEQKVRGFVRLDDAGLQARVAKRLASKEVIDKAGAEDATILGETKNDDAKEDTK